jgi:hypothetical protein
MFSPKAGISVLVDEVLKEVFPVHGLIGRLGYEGDLVNTLGGNNRISISRQKLL